MGGPSIDAEIRSQFSPLVEKARASQLTTWSSTSRGSLALVLLDQFPRNLYRGLSLSYSSDDMALDVAARGIARGFTKDLTTLQSQLFYLPFMQSENLVSQLAAVKFYEALVAKAEGEDKEQLGRSLEFAEKYLVPILRFGRFPSRNQALGRESTKEEEEWHREHPNGF